MADGVGADDACPPGRRRGIVDCGSFPAIVPRIGAGVALRVVAAHVKLAVAALTLSVELPPIRQRPRAVLQIDRHLDAEHVVDRLRQDEGTVQIVRVVVRQAEAA